MSGATASTHMSGRTVLPFIDTHTIKVNAPTARVWDVLVVRRLLSRVRRAAERD